MYAYAKQGEYSTEIYACEKNPDHYTDLEEAAYEAVAAMYDAADAEYTQYCAFSSFLSVGVISAFALNLLMF